jgi:hypothetical protein
MCLNCGGVDSASASASISSPRAWTPRWAGKEDGLAFENKHTAFSHFFHGCSHCSRYFALLLLSSFSNPHFRMPGMQNMEAATSHACRGARSVGYLQEKVHVLLTVFLDILAS